MTDAQPTPSLEAQLLVQVRELKKHFPVRRGLIIEREGQWKLVSYANRLD